MKGVRNLIGFALLLVGVSVSAAAQRSSAPSYQISSDSSGAVTVERGGKRSVYQPTFTIIRAEADPKLGLSAFASTPGESLEGVNVENYPLPNWRAAKGGKRTDTVYEAGAVTVVRATGSRSL